MSESQNLHTGSGSFLAYFYARGSRGWTVPKRLLLTRKLSKSFFSHLPPPEWCFTVRALAQPRAAVLAKEGIVSKVNKGGPLPIEYALMPA